MKNTKRVLLAILLLTSLNAVAQIPFEVDKILEIRNGDTVEVDKDLTKIGIKQKFNTGKDYIKIFFISDRPELIKPIKFRSKKLEIIESDFNEEWGGTFLCSNNETGTIKVVHDWMKGEIHYDSNSDGLFEKIIVLK